MTETPPSTRLDRLMLAGAALVLLAAIAWVLMPSGARQYHLIISGLRKGQIASFTARFHPYKDRHVGGAAHAVTLLDDLIASLSGRPFNVVSLGNDLSGSSEAYFSRGQAVVETMNCFHLDAMLIGNLDLSFGASRLRELRSTAAFPFLSSNMVDEGTLQPPDYLIPELLLKHDSHLSVGLLGLTPPDTPHLTASNNVQGLRFLSAAKALPERAARLRKSGATLIVLLTLFDRNRLPQETWDAIRTAAPDIVIMLDFDVEPPLPHLRDGILVKTINGYNQGKEIDLLSLELTAAGRIDRFASRRIPVFSDELVPHPRTRTITEEAQQRIAEVRSELITVFPQSLEKQYASECPIGNLITDAMRRSTGCDLAFHNSGGIQSNIASGPFSRGDLYNVLPFDNEMVTMDLTGQSILELLTLSASLKRGILQISGGSYTFANRSIDDYELKEVRIGDELLQATRTYRITTNSFLADGGDEYRPFQQGKNQIVGPLVRDVFSAFLTANSASETRVLSPSLLLTAPRIRRE